MTIPPPGTIENETKKSRPAFLGALLDSSPTATVQPAENIPPSLERLRELRAEVQDLQEVLTQVANGQITLQSYAPYVKKSMEEISALMKNIHGEDSIRHLQNQWEQMQVCPLLVNPEGQFSPQEQLNYLGVIENKVRKIIYQVGMLSIANRLNFWLSKARPGYYIPFHVVFEDEVPNLEDRQKILNFLAITPEVIKEGYVDASNGLVYRYSRHTIDRFSSIVTLIVAFVIATGLVAGSAYVPFKDWPIRPDNLGVMISGWGALLFGIVVHLAVGNAKRKQDQAGLPPVVAVGDLPVIINARLGQFLIKILMALIGLFGLVFSTSIQQITMFNAFLVGYSLDSFIELFSTSIEQRASAQVSAMKEQLQEKG
jgi:hypothetical protein